MHFSLAHSPRARSQGACVGAASACRHPAAGTARGLAAVRLRRGAAGQRRPPVQCGGPLQHRPERVTACRSGNPAGLPARRSSRGHGSSSGAGRELPRYIAEAPLVSGWQPALLPRPSRAAGRSGAAALRRGRGAPGSGRDGAAFLPYPGAASGKGRAAGSCALPAGLLWLPAPRERPAPKSMPRVGSSRRPGPGSRPSPG